MSGGTSEGSDQPVETADLRSWYGTLRDELAAKPPRDVARELPGLTERVETLSEEADDDHRIVVGVSFTTNYTCLDYCIDRVLETPTDGQRVETVKEPVSASHRYVRFTCPPDPHFDPCALRALLLSAVDREYRRGDDQPTSGLARVWESFGAVE